MPYAPGVVDRSGELLAAGRMDMARGLAQGIGSVGDAMQEYRQNKMRNSVLEGKNAMMLQIFEKDPELQKYAPPGTNKLIEQLKAGGNLDLKKNMMLNASLTTALEVSKHIGDREQQQAAAEYNKKNAQQLGMAIENTLKERKQEEAFKGVLLDMRKANPDTPLSVKDYLKAQELTGVSPKVAGGYMDISFKGEEIQSALDLRKQEIEKMKAQKTESETRTKLAGRAGETQSVTLDDGSKVTMIFDAQGNPAPVKPYVDPSTRTPSNVQLMQAKVEAQQEIRALMEAGDPQSRDKAFAIWTSQPGNSVDSITGRTKDMTDFERWWEGMRRGAKAPAKDIIIDEGKPQLPAGTPPLKVSGVRLKSKG